MYQLFLNVAQKPAKSRDKPSLLLHDAVRAVPFLVVTIASQVNLRRKTNACL